MGKDITKDITRVLVLMLLIESFAIRVEGCVACNQLNQSKTLKISLALLRNVLEMKRHATNA
ncbi:hypothetical protein ACP4OV_027661 [Aristida adscensionis]